MYCSKCGSWLADGVRFCTKCGSPTGVYAPNPGQPVNEPMNQAMKLSEYVVPNPASSLRSKT